MKIPKIKSSHLKSNIRPIKKNQKKNPKDWGYPIKKETEVGQMNI